MAASDAYIERLQRLDYEGEGELLEAILRAGFDQGCVISPREDQVLPYSAPGARHVIEAVSGRRLARASGDDPFPDGLPVGAMPTQEPRLVVLTQRCDLIAGLVAEPFVELAQVVAVDASSDEARSARLNSARLIAIAEDGEQLWAADLRVKAWLPKDLLPCQDAINVVPKGLPRDRFRLRLGQRFSRQALSAELVVRVQRPLIDRVIGRNATARSQGAIFTDWLLAPEDGKFTLLAVVSQDHSLREGDDAYEQLSQHFPEDLESLLTDSSGAISMEQLDFLTWLTALKINLDELSWHPTKSGGHAEPTR